MATLTAYPPEVAADATALIIFSGPANVRVEWSMTGTGGITPQSDMTDENGIAAAIYTPGVSGDTPTITATHGT